MANFEEQLINGQVGESAIANFLKNKGWAVMPVYELEKEFGKGPQVFLKDESIIAPDAIIFKGEEVYWIEAKHKTAFSYYRKKGIWTTGIDLRHYEHYCRIDDISPFPVWLFFLHKGGTAKDSPVSESGLFCETLANLRRTENHRSDKYGRSGMVYWDKENLRKIGEYNHITGEIVPIKLKVYTQ